MPWMEWYNALAKLSWTPAPATIGLIWTILFAAVIASCAVTGRTVMTLQPIDFSKSPR